MAASEQTANVLKCPRTHLALAKDSPVPRAAQSRPAGRIVATPEVGGLHHRYDRVAA